MTALVNKKRDENDFDIIIGFLASSNMVGVKNTKRSRHVF